MDVLLLVTLSVPHRCITQMILTTEMWDNNQVCVAEREREREEGGGSEYCRLLSLLSMQRRVIVNKAPGGWTPSNLLTTSHCCMTKAPPQPPTLTRNPLCTTPTCPPSLLRWQFLEVKAKTNHWFTGAQNKWEQAPRGFQSSLQYSISPASPFQAADLSE